MDKKQFIKIAKGAVLIYMASFLILNWNDVSWIFNYRAVSGLINDFFNPYPSIDAFTLDLNFYPNHSEHAGQAIEEVKTTYTEKNNILEIPKLSIEVPIVFSQNTDKAAIVKDLDSGVVYYPGSVLPGQKGQIVVLGHSAPPGWPKIKYDWVFSDLNDLKYGDQIRLYFDNKEYIYRVREKKIIAKGQEIVPTSLIKDGNILILVSCWPPGKNLQRIAVQAELN